MTITGTQVREARELLGWTREDVAGASGLNVADVLRFEAGLSDPGLDALTEIRRTLEAAGVEFTKAGQPGVDLKSAPLVSRRPGDG